MVRSAAGRLPLVRLPSPLHVVPSVPSDSGVFAVRVIDRLSTQVFLGEAQLLAGEYDAAQTRLHASSRGRGRPEAPQRHL